MVLQKKKYFLKTKHPNCWNNIHTVFINIQNEKVAARLLHIDDIERRVLLAGESGQQVLEGVPLGQVPGPRAHKRKGGGKQLWDSLVLILKEQL